MSPWPQLRQDDPWRGSAHGSENVAALDEALALIPADAGVAADWFTVTHLAERVDAYMLPNPFQNRYYGAGEPYTPSHEDVDWVVAQRWALGDTEVQFVFEALRRSPDWETAVDDDFVLVMKRRDALSDRARAVTALPGKLIAAQPTVNSTKGAPATHRGRMCSAFAGTLSQLSVSIRYKISARLSSSVIS